MSVWTRPCEQAEGEREERCVCGSALSEWNLSGLRGLRCVAECMWRRQNGRRWKAKGKVVSLLMTGIKGLEHCAYDGGERTAGVEEWRLVCPVWEDSASVKMSTHFGASTIVARSIRASSAACQQPGP